MTNTLHGYGDTMGNRAGGIYEPLLKPWLERFPHWLNEATHAELIIRLIMTGAIENQGHIHVGPKLRAEFGVNEKGARI